ncbi:MULTISPECIES: EamA family transporter RarD [Gemmobacter]|jgi:chloramphenicol-sensitive protein RarD|uniref:Chloramphenicol-sensitive protein RarD n=2 Tax=Gemmobacter TaxID=204456 RepID=A0A2T6AQ97_9RHOB|nr:MULTISPECIES: EamA family transporter RarD [Gemmobacter]OJY32657.1 MAG: permease [Rhodobacterales bacterium 65-51]PTX45960.1 chloramphenicol-sensitive protein RarD [Gemmobacter caeni]TWI94262.1 chloramphenicol-sensitive protein RarD [Gemmobacter caeni]GHC09797.1 permease [Gemmobacter nanjingensis]
MNTDTDSPRGLAFALGAYMLWGVLPIYMKALSHVPAAEVLAHRVIWSVPVAGAVLIWLGRTADLTAALRSPRMLAMGGLTATIISINWGIYIWAIQNGHTLDAALGYYINPLVTVFLGAATLGERLNRWQTAALALAACAVAVLTWEAGRLPLLALSLTASWAAYAWFKKQLPIGPNQGFMLEVVLLSPFALAWIVWLAITGQGHFASGDLTNSLMLASAGLVTAVPLILYANGAKLLRLTTIGILQYVSPTMIFLVAVFLFHEPFSTAKAVAFPMIWAALAVYTFGMMRARRALA